MSQLRPAVAAIIGAAATALVFGVVLAMMASSVAAAPADTVVTARTVNVETTATSINAMVTILDSTGQSNVLLSGEDEDGQSQSASKSSAVTVPAGGVVTVTVLPIISGSGWSTGAEVACGIYEGSDSATRKELSVHKSAADSTTAAATICTWTNS